MPWPTFHDKCSTLWWASLELICVIHQTKNSILKSQSPLTKRFLILWANSVLIGVSLETLRSRFGHFTANDKLRFAVNGFKLPDMPIFGTSDSRVVASYSSRLPCLFTIHPLTSILAEKKCLQNYLFWNGIRSSISKRVLKSRISSQSGIVMF